ncbi:hypothetical protein PoB_001819200 [Plakobranchus ocellatus]|uniref:Uncharacterized protein n=1 Tax=Plakobranchus ocellatus TaxID=259542 RepID=A0AAV3ZAX6_9GAST|nr:hypothetical protein PoB_001819200 [Plakobranchus ocellatus]
MLTLESFWGRVVLACYTGETIENSRKIYPRFHTGPIYRLFSPPPPISANPRVVKGFTSQDTVLIISGVRTVVVSPLPVLTTTLTAALSCCPPCFISVEGFVQPFPCDHQFLH